jgi:hypothetical protein
LNAIGLARAPWFMGLVRAGGKCGPAAQAGAILMALAE